MFFLHIVHTNREYIINAKMRLIGDGEGNKLSNIVDSCCDILISNISIGMLEAAKKQKWITVKIQPICFLSINVIPAIGSIAKGRT